MHIPDFDLRACPAAKVLGRRLVRAPIDANTTLYGWVEFAQWSAPPDRLGYGHWYEVRFTPLGESFNGTWIPVPTTSALDRDRDLNRLHFSVLERSAAHPDGLGRVARLGPIGHIRTDPTSKGLGTYLRDELIDWVASLHPDATVEGGKLSHVDAGDENSERRRRFYEGGKFEVRLNEGGSGAFWAKRLDGLQRHTHNRKVVEVGDEEVQRLLECTPALEDAKRALAELEEERSQLQDDRDRARARLFWTRVGAGALVVALVVMTAQGKLGWYLF